MTLSALETVNGSDSTSTFDTETTSGAAAGTIGIAGSVSIGIITITATATISPNAVVNANGGDVSISAASAASSTNKAQPKLEGATGKTVGVGASVSLTILNDTTTASIGDNATLAGANNVTLAATATDSATGFAKNGAAGGVAVTADVAIMLSNVTTSTIIGVGGLITTTGAISATATQTALATSDAEGSAKGDNVGIGAALGLTIANHIVTSTTNRNLTAGGAITFAAHGSSITEADSVASAAGAKDKNSNDAGDTNHQSNSQLGFANSTASSNGASDSGESSTPKATTSDSGGSSVEVAAAISINMQTATAEAKIPQDLTIIAGGRLTLSASQNADGKASADGSATDAGTVGIGAAVAVNLVTVTNDASIDGNAQISSNGVAIEALMTNRSGDTTHTFEADATSGAGAGTVGIAGSVAINIITLNTTALIHDDGARAPPTTVNANGGDVSLTAGSTASSSVSATPKIDTGGTGDTVGIGLSVALNIVNDTTTAALDDSSVVTGAHNLSLTATSTDTMNTFAKNGAGGEVAVDADVAISLSTVTTSTTIGHGDTLTATGSISANATQTAKVTTNAEGAAKGSDVGVGAALSLTIATHLVQSTTYRNLVAGGDVTFGAFGASASETDATSSAAGGKSKSDSSASHDGDTSQQADSQLGFGKQTASDNGTSAPSDSSTPKAQTSDSSGDSSVEVAAAIAINVQHASSLAILPDHSTITAGGSVSFKTSANTDGKAKADGTATDASSVGIGAAVSVNFVDMKNTATTGDFSTIMGNGLNVDATMTHLGSDATSSFDAEAHSGAGSSDVGVAGSVALNIISDQTTAIVYGHTVVTAGTGDVTVLAENLTEANASAISDAQGGSSSVGVGASVALNILTPMHTYAQVQDGAVLTGGHNVTVQATASQNNVTTTVHAGSAGGDAISPAVAIAIVTTDTNASVGTGTGLSASGNVTIQASYSGTVTTSGDATAAGSSVAVGAIVGLNIVSITTAGTTTRNIVTTGGFVTVASSSQIAASTIVEASAKGEDSGGKSSDQQANDQVKNNKQTQNTLPGGSSTSLPSANDNASSGNSTASGQSSGESGGGVGIGAAVSINWVTMTNTASVAPNLTVSATGAVSVLAQQQGDATAKATGTSMDSSASTNIGAAVGFNYVNITSHGEIGDNAVISGNGVFVTALTPVGQENDVVVWGLSAAGGTESETSVAASVGLNIVSFDIRARIGSNVTLNNTGGIGANASSPMGLQNVAAAGAFAGSGNGVGAALALNVFTIHVDAVVDTNTHGTAGGAISVTAASGIATLPIVVPIPSANFTIDFTNVAISGAAGDGDAAIAGSVSINVLDLRTRAWIADNVQINAAAVLPGSSAQVAATDVSAVKTIAGALAATTGSAGIGAALIVDVISKDTRAYIGKSVILRVAGNVSITTTAGMDYFGVSASAGASTSAAVSGSLVVLILDQGGSDGTRAFIDGGAATPTTVQAGGALSVTASAPNTYQLYTGQVAVASSAGIGVSVVVFVNTGVVDAYIASYDTIGAGPGGVAVSASQSEDITLVAVGGSVGGSVGIAGSAVIDILLLTTTGHIDDHVSVTSGGKIAVSASDATTIKGVAGSLAIGGSAGVGLGVDVEVPQKDTEAWIGDFVNATAGGDVTVDATSSESLISIAAGASVGGTAGVAVNAAVSVINVTTKATIGANASVIADGSVRVSAGETLSDDLIAGNFAAGGSAGVGAAASVPIITKTTIASIGDNSTVVGRGNGAGLTVSTGNYTVTTIDTRFNAANAVEGNHNTLNLGYTDGFAENELVHYDAGGGTAIGGLVDGHDYYVHPTSDHEVQLTDYYVDSTHPLVPITLSAGVGESHRLVSTDHAGVASDDSPRFDPATDVNSASSTITLPYSLGLGTGDPVVYSSGGGAPIGGLQDGGTYYVIGSTSGPFKLAASKDDATAGTFIHLDASQATGRSHSLVKQGDMLASDASAAGPRVIAPGVQSGFHGVAVTAMNSDDIAAVGASVGVGGGAGVAVGGTVDVITATTKASIGKNTHINDPVSGVVDPNQSVLVAAGDAFHLVLVAAAIVAGTVGVGVGVTVGLIDLTTDAIIDDSATVRAAKDVVVNASGNEGMTSVTASGGGGFVGVAGAVTVFLLNVHTFANTGTFITIAAGNNAQLAAQDDTKFVGVTGGLAVGFVGVGAGVSIISVNKDVEAFLGASATVSAAAGALSGLGGISNGSRPQGTSYGATASFHGLAVQARSSENIFGIVIAIAGGFVGVSVPVGVTLLHVTTSAFIAGGSDITSTFGSVEVAALDSFKSLTIAGGIAGGFVGVGAGVDIGIADTGTSAFIGGGAVVHAGGDVNVYALASKDVSTYVVAIGIGAVGAAGAVSIWNVGTQPSTTYNASGPEKGPWSPSATYKRGDVVTGSDGNKYAAKVDNPSGDPTVSSDWQPADQDANTGTGSDATSEADSQSTGSGNGYQSILSGTSGSYGPNADGRIQSATGTDSSSGANKSIHDKAVNGAGVTHTAMTTTVPRGTSAIIDGTVVAGGSVRVVADDGLKFFGLAGAAAGGVVGFGAAILVANLSSATDAHLTSNANVTAGGQIFIHAGLSENSEGLAFAGTAGVVAVSAQVAVLTDTSSQTAHIDAGAQIHGAPAGIVVEAITGRDIEALALGGGFGAVAAGAAIGLPDVTSTTTAHVGTITMDGTIGGLTVKASSDLSITALSVAVEGGIGIALNATVAVVQPDVTVSATLDPNTFTVTGDVLVEAISAADLSADAIGVSIAGLGALGASVAIATFVAPITGTIAAGSNITAGGTVRARALHNYDESGTALNRSVHARAISGSGSVGVSGAGAFAFATDSPTLDAYIGVNADVAPSPATTVHGSAEVWAGANNQADATAIGIAVAGLVGLAGALAKTAVGGHVHAQLNASVLGGVSVTVKAVDTSTLDTETTAGAGGLLAGEINLADSRLTTDVFADIGQSETVSVSGPVLVRAQGSGDAIANAIGSSIGFIAIGATIANAIMKPGFLAYIGAHTSVTGGDIGVQTWWNDDGNDPIAGKGAHASALAPGGGLFAAQGAVPTATIQVSTIGYVDATATLNCTGAITVQALSSNEADSTAFALAVGAVGVGASLVNATVTDTTRARLLGAVTGAGSVAVLATGNERATASATAASGGLLVAADAALAHAYVKQNGAGDPTLEAMVGTNGIHSTGDITVDSLLLGATDAEAIGVAISGLGAGGGSIADAEMNPVVQSFISGGTITSTSGGIGVSARYNASDVGNNISGSSHSANASGLGVAAGTFLGVNGTHATAHDNASVTAYIPDGLTISGGGPLAHGPSAGWGVAVLTASWSNVNSKTFGLTLGGLAAVGDSVAHSTFDGQTFSHLDSGVVAGASLQVASFGTARTTADATALGGGLFAAVNGAEAHAFVVPDGGGDQTVRSTLGTHNVTVTGAVSLSSQLIATADATTEGVQIALGGSGGSADSQALLTTRVETTILGGTITSSGGGVSLSSRYNANSNGGNISGVTNTANAEASEAAASGFLSLNGSSASALDHGLVNAWVPSNVTISAGTGVVSVNASTYSGENAKSSGLTIGGLAAAGGSTSTAIYDGTSRARLEGPVTSGGGVAISAFGGSKTSADATALGGGIFAAGSGAEAIAKVIRDGGSDATVQASIGSLGVSVTGDITLASSAFATAKATTEGVQIALGGSGGKAASTALVAPDIETFIAGGLVTASVGGIGLSSLLNANSTGGNTSGTGTTVDAEAVEAAGALFGTINGAEATATDSSIVNVNVADGVVLSGHNALSSGVLAGIGIALLASQFSVIKATTDGLSIGGLVALGGATSNATFNGTVRSHLDGAVTSGFSLGISSYGTAETTAKATALGGGLGVAILGAEANALVQPDGSGDAAVQASLGSHNVTVSNGASLSSFLVGTADAQTLGVQISGLASGGKAQSHAFMTPSVLTFINGGTINAGSGGVALSARYSANADGSNATGIGTTVNAKAVEAAASGFASINGAEALATDSTVVDAHVANGVTLAGGGQHSLLAASFSVLSAVSDGLAIAGLAAVGGSTSKATFNGTSRARLDGGITSGGGLAVSAFGTARTTATATALGGGIGVAINGAEADAVVQLDGSGDATVQASLDSHNVTVNGNVALSSYLVGTADAETLGVQIAGIGSGGKALSNATMSGDVETVINGGTINAGSGGVSLSGRYSANADGSNSTGVGTTVKATSQEAAASGFGSITGSEANATDSTIVNVHVASGATLAGSGAHSLLAASYSTLDAESSGLTAAGIFAVGVSDSTATFNGTSRARLDGGISSGGSLTISGFGTALTTSTATALSGGLFIAANAGDAKALVQLDGASDATVQASTGTRNITVAGDIVLASVLMATVDAKSLGVAIGGLGSGGKAQAHAFLTPDV